MNANDYRPSWRKPVGMLVILCLIAGWAFLVGEQSVTIGRLHVVLQAALYVFAGIIWIFPAMPILRWMETGSFSKNSK